MNNLLPQVHSKKGLQDYESVKIYNSLLKETTLKDYQAHEVCNLTTRRIVSNKITWLSGAHIREIVCSVMAENGYYKERLQYTRVGIPYYDLEKVFKGVKLNTYTERAYGTYDLIRKEYKEVKELIEQMEGTE